MSRSITIVCMLSACLVTMSAITTGATERPRLLDSRVGSVRSGGSLELATTEVDTFYLLGGPGRYDGRFENQSGMPDWQGWTHHDATHDPDPRWQVSEFQAQSGAYSMWCGTVFPDGDPGYGNDWFKSLVFEYPATDNSLPATVRWQATLRVDVEPIYDWVYLQYNSGGEWLNLHAFDGEQIVRIDETIDFQPGQYTGPGQDLIQLRVRVESDFVWSDEDDLWDTDGACQYDDVTVTVDGLVVDVEDFEDQVSDHWLPVAEQAVGDFTAIWSNLIDLDLCIENWSPQVAFIDDGIVVPGTGGTPCITWCYGPGGYIVNNTGGLAGSVHHINNYAVSPALEWPTGANAAYLQFLVYEHETLLPGSAGMFYMWYVRSVDTGDPADLVNANWKNRNYVEYGGPGYLLRREALTDLLESGLTHLQVALRVSEMGYMWGWDGPDGTPAPYFDSVQVVAYEHAGPSISARTVDLYNDGFPASGGLDFDDLASNAVRLDMAANISPPDHLRNDPGDSLVFWASTIRDGAVLNDFPKVFVRMKANRVFRDVRTMPTNFTLQVDGLGYSDLVTGWVYADTVYNANGGLVAGRWACDLPDEAFFYPGDVIHYFIEAKDNQAGDIGVSLLPADTTGFSSFHELDEYDNQFSVRALPSLHSTAEGDQPKVLFWDDHGVPEAQDVWRSMLGQNYHDEGDEYDLFATQSPTSAVGNGLGGRATIDQLAHYDIILYSAGNLSRFLLGDGDFETDPSDDIGLLTAWLNLGDKNLLLSGDDVAGELGSGSSAGYQFLNDHVGLALIDRDIRPLIGNQTTPLVRIEPANGVIALIDRWVTYGGCLHINEFDAVTTVGTTTRLAEFTDAAGNSGVYPYAAASWRRGSVNDSDVILLPFDLTFLYADFGWIPPAGHAGHSARTVLLDDVLGFFGSWVIPPPGVAPDAVLRVTQYPNPFNPATTIALDLPHAGNVSLRIFDLRGVLVRTLVDERLAAGHHEIVWNGDDQRGAQAASGVYFAEIRAASEVRVQKLALVK